MNFNINQYTRKAEVNKIRYFTKITANYSISNHLSIHFRSDWRTGRDGGTDLELGRFQGDRNANEYDSGEGNCGIALPMYGPTVRPTTHTPDLSPEISTMRVVSSAGHFSVYR